MPCEGNNCDRRQQLLSELKSFVARMDQKDPHEWDVPAGNSPRTRGAAGAIGQEPPLYSIPVKPSKSYEFRGSMMYRCECIKKNGLQDHCMFSDCMGRPECMTDVLPTCLPGRAALLKLTGVDGPQVALEKLHVADRARDSALAAYCRLVSSAQSSSNQLQSRNYGPRIHNNAQKIRSSPADAHVQQQLYRPQIQRHQQQQQQNEQVQQPQPYCHLQDWYPTYYPQQYPQYYPQQNPQYYPQWYP